MKNKIKIVGGALIVCAVILSMTISSMAETGPVEYKSIDSNNNATWYNGNIKEEISLVSDEIIIYTKGKKNTDMAIKNLDQDAVVVNSHDYVKIIRLPKKLDTKSLEEKAKKFQKDTGIKANLVFNRGGGDDVMALTGEVVVKFKNGWNDNKVSEWTKNNNVQIIKKLSDISTNAYVLDVGPGIISLDIANQLYLSGDAEYAYPNWWKTMTLKEIPNDPLFSSQWHLQNTGQGGGTAGEDVNVVGVWNTYKGSNSAIIGIVDDGVEIGHEDLLGNILNGYSYDYVDGDGDPTGGSHGTSVAGVAAGRGFNGIGITGVAPWSKLVGYRLLDAWTPSNEADALTRNGVGIVDIYSNSWGPADDRHLEAPGPLTKDAFKSGTTNGRGGKGNIYVWAGGNGNSANNLYDDNSNYDGYANNRYVFAIAASNNKGVQSSYSEDGANILVNVPSSDGGMGITTTDRTGSVGYDPGNYTSSFGGTSSAAPLASGIISLMLDANPNLGWRDVRLILAKSAEKNNPGDTDWTTNGAGLHINHKYGYGRIDANAAINMVNGWTNVGPEIMTEAFKSPNSLISYTGISDTVSISDNIKVENVEIYFTAADHPYWGDLDIELISPSGTKSKLATRHYIAGGYGSSQKYDNWVFSSARYIDENSAGTWTLKAKDTRIGYSGHLQNWGIRIYGTGISTTPPLSVTISESPDPVISGQASQVTVHVESPSGAIGDAGVSLSLTGGGSLNTLSGSTDANGNFIATYTAPSVSTTTTVTISATATKNGYVGSSGSDQITINPETGPNYQLMTTVSESIDPVLSGGTSQVTVHVERECGTDSADACPAIYHPPWIPAQGADIILSTTGGILAYTNGVTNSNGNFTTNYTAPTVGSTYIYTISATASKTGYLDGLGSDGITINPQPVPTSNIKISSVMFDALGTDSQYNINGEYVKITNSGTTSSVLTGWKLYNKTDNWLYTIPTFTLGSGRTMTVYSGTGTNIGTILYMGYNRHVWANTNECARLKDTGGNLISEKCI